jgi:hypothetical protein
MTPHFLQDLMMRSLTAGGNTLPLIRFLALASAIRVGIRSNLCSIRYASHAK